MTTLTLQLELPENVLERLHQEAALHNLPVDEVVHRAVIAYLEEDDLSDAAILANFRQGLQEALHGTHRPAREVLAELTTPDD